jgi:lipoprotein-releasing system permease protein
MYRLFLAIRYLLTRPINLLGMTGILLSVWALVVVVSLFSGFLRVVETHVHDASADLTVDDLPATTGVDRLLAELQADDNVAACAPRLVHYALLHRAGKAPPPPALPGRMALHGGDQPFLFLLGIDPAAEMQVTGLPRWLTATEIPADWRVADLQAPLADRNGMPTVLVGAERMRAEGLRPGDQVLLTTGLLQRDADGNARAVQRQLPFVIAGAFKTRYGGFDGNNLLVRRDVLQRSLFADQPGLVHEVAVRVHDTAQIDATASRLSRATFGVTDQNDGRARGRVQTWRQKNKVFLQSVEHQRALLKIVLIVIMVVAAFLMLATLSMMVTEKIADIGILTALGGTPLGVTQVFLACGLCITAAGVVLGLLLGSLTAIYLEEVRQALLWAFGIDLFPLAVYNLDRVPCHLDPAWLVQVTLLAFATGTVVAALPALRAARHDPLVSLRGH